MCVDTTAGCCVYVYVCVLSSSGVKELVTRLNFSEAELSLHQKSGLSHSLLHKSGMTDSRRETSLAMFNTTLDCEKRVSHQHYSLIIPYSPLPLCACQGILSTYRLVHIVFCW